MTHLDRLEDGRGDDHSSSNSVGCTLALLNNVPAALRSQRVAGTHPPLPSRWPFPECSNQPHSFRGWTSSRNGALGAISALFFFAGGFRRKTRVKRRQNEQGQQSGADKSNDQHGCERLLQLSSGSGRERTG